MPKDNDNLPVAFNPDLDEGPGNPNPNGVARRDALEVWEEDQAKRDANQKGKGGRPIKEVDWNIVKGLCKLFCTQEEVAGVLEISVDTLGRRIREKFGEKFTWYDLFNQYSVEGKISLRRAQFESATKGKNVLMQIWLGKQALGQRDTPAPAKDLANEKPEDDVAQDVYGVGFYGAPGQEQLPVNAPPEAVRPSNASQPEPATGQAAEVQTSQQRADEV